MTMTAIDEIIERVVSDMNRSRLTDTNDFMFGVHANDALAIIAELETLRETVTLLNHQLSVEREHYQMLQTERDALLTWLERISLLASSGQDDTIVDTLQSTIRITREFAEEALSTAALNTQPAPPQAEWTPDYDPRKPVFDIGQSVRETRGRFRFGVVTDIRYSERSGIPRYMTDIDPLYTYTADGLEPVKG